MAHSHDVVLDPFTQSLISIKAAHLCRRSDFSRSDDEDLAQGMRVYILTKAHLFDPARGPLEAFVTNAINTWIGMDLRFRGRDKRRGNITAVSLDTTQIECDGESDTLHAVISDADLHRRTNGTSPSPIDQLELTEAVHHAFSKLTEDEQTLARFVADHGVAAAAREWSRRRGRKTSRRWVERSLARMRDRFIASGFGAR